MSEWTDLDFEARRAAHRRGHSKPLRNRAAIDRSYDAVASSTVGISVAQFAPNGELTDANIDDAIDAAIAQAIELTGPGLEGPGYAISFPAGKWTLARPHVIPAFGEYRCAVGVQGAGMNDTIFLVESDDAASAAFTFGTASFPDPSDIGFTLYLRVLNFSIIAASDGDCNRTGVRCYGAVNPLIQGVRVRGLVSESTTYSQGRGIEILPVSVDGTELNSQFVDMRNCDVYGCMTGIFVRLAYPCTFDNVNAQGCLFENAIFQGCTVVWNNSGIQGGSLGLYPERWYGNRNMPGVVSGFDATTGLGSGTGATCGAETDEVCVVTGLSGLDAREDTGRWLELTPAGATANELKVRGVYKIERVLSATSCSIRKGSNHTSQGSLSWQLRQAAGQVTLALTNVYNESGAARSTIGAWRDDIGGSSYLIDSAEFQGGDFVIEAYRVASVTVRGIRESNSALQVAKLEFVNWSDIEADISEIEVDDYSYSGLVCRDNQAFPNGSWSKGVSRSANGGSQVRLRAALQEMGAVEIWDVRVASSLSLTGSDVNSITGLVNGTVLTPADAAPAGLKPTYTAADAGLVAPAIISVSGAGAARSAMEGIIDSTVLPAHDYTTTIVAVCRMPDTVVNDFRRVQVRTEGSFPAFVQHFIGLNDNQYIATGPYAYYRNHDNRFPNTEGSASYSLTADTDPHCFITSAVHSANLSAQVQSWEDAVWMTGGLRSTFPSHFVGADMLVGVGAEYNAVNSGSLRWTLVAVIPRSLSHAEHQKIIDLARNEFPLAES
jgi:hypothetical protein